MTPERRRPPGWALRRFLAARACFTRTETVVDGCRISARRATATPERSSPPVVMLAGLGLSGRYLLPVSAELARRYPVWVPDLPGQGRSEGPRTALDLPGLGDFVVAWMDRAGVGQAALVGNSVGCQVAVEAAARHPDRVTHVVLEGPTMDAEARTVPRQAWRIAVDALREPVSLGPLQTGDWLGTGPRRLAATVGHAMTHELEARLPAVTCPALVVRGSRDPIVPQRWAEQVAAALPRGRLEVVVGGSHAMTYSNPRALAELVTDFLARPATDGAGPPRVPPDAAG